MRALGLALVALLSMPSCKSPCDDDLAPATRAQVSPPLDRADSWVYQLQGDVAALNAARYPLAVVDYSDDGSEIGERTAAQVSLLREGGRVALAYLSIGEAEEGRFYYGSMPKDLIAATNEAFTDNFKVRFCDERWHQIMLSYLDRIIAQGFDGVYLDIVEGYRFFTPDCVRFCADECAGDTAATEMAALITRLAEHARVTRNKPNFLLIAQNGVEIINELRNQGDDYIATIDGVAIEDAFHFDDGDTLAVNAGLSPQCEDVLPALDRFVSVGKRVLAVDYLTSGGKIDDFYERAKRRGYVPYAAPTRDLDRIADPR